MAADFDRLDGLSDESLNGLIRECEQNAARQAAFTLPASIRLFFAAVRDNLVDEQKRRTRAERSPELVHTVRKLMDDYGSISFTREYAEGILLVAEEYFEQAFADAQPGPDLDFLRSLVPYVWARWR